MWSYRDHGTSAEQLKFTHTDQVMSSEGSLFHVQPTLDAMPATFLSNLQPALDATLSTFLGSLQHALDATLSTFLSKHLFSAVFHDACMMEIKTQEHPELQKLLYGYCWRQSLGPLTPEEFLKEICKAVKACKCFWNKGKLKKWNANKKSFSYYTKGYFFRQQTDKWRFAVAKTTFMLTWCSRNHTANFGLGTW